MYVLREAAGRRTQAGRIECPDGSAVGVQCARRDDLAGAGSRVVDGTASHDESHALTDLATRTGRVLLVTAASDLALVAHRCKRERAKYENKHE